MKKKLNKSQRKRIKSVNRKYRAFMSRKRKHKGHERLVY